MKKNSKAIKRRYSNIPKSDSSFYGVFVSHGRVKVDTKRFIRVMGNLLDKEDIASMNVPRNSVYLEIPKRFRSEYSSNVVGDEVEKLISLWREEFAPAMAKLETPSERGEKVRLNTICGRLDEDASEEADVAELLATAKRGTSFRHAVRFITYGFLQMSASQIDSTVFSEMVKRIPSVDCGKNPLAIYNKEILKISKNQTPYNDAYNELHALVNFLKHGSDESKKTAEKFPSININKGFKRTMNPMLNLGRWGSGDIPQEMDRVKQSLIRAFAFAFSENQQKIKWFYQDFFFDKIKEFKNLNDF